MAGKRTLTVEILGDAKSALNSFSQVNKGLSGLGTDFVNFGKKVALGFAAFTAGAVVIGKDLVNAASDLNENLSKTNVIFGDAAGAVIQFSKDAATAFGISQNAALDAAGQFGIFGKAAGLTGGNLSGFTTELIGLASDLASFNNTSPEEAILAIGAALRGESEPIRRYGVLINDAALKQKALELGIYEGNGTLTAQQKILAANALIFEQTSDAQGDFARTSDGLANQQRILAARFDNLKTRLGTALLPIALKVADAFGDLIDRVSPLVDRYLPKLQELFRNVVDRIKPVVQQIRDALEPILRKIGDWMKDNTDVVKVFFGVLAGAVVIAGVAGLAAALVSLVNPITLIIGGIAAVAAGIYYAYTRFESFREIVQTVKDFFVQSVVPALQDTFDALRNIFEAGVAAISWIWENFGDSILRYITTIWDAINKQIEGALLVIRGIFDIFIGVFTGDWGRAWEGIKNILGGAMTWMKGVVQAVTGQIKFAFEVMGTGIGMALGGLKNLLTGFIGWISSVFVGGFTLAKNLIVSIFSTILGAVTGMVKGAINYFISAINGLINLINRAIRAYNSIPLAPDIGTIPNIPRLAAGGIVTEPTLAIVGEAGPEAVVPLSPQYMPDFLAGAAPRGGGDTYITVSVDAGLVSSPDQVGQQIIEAIRRAERRSGQVFAGV